MKINNNGINSTGAAVQAPASKLGGQTGNTSGPTSRQTGDQVQISGFASQLAGDPSKVTRLRSSLDAGAYHIAPAAVAASLIQEAMLA